MLHRVRLPLLQRSRLPTPSSMRTRALCQHATSPTSPPTDSISELRRLASSIRQRRPPLAVTFLLGGPGSGKGTLAAAIATHDRTIQHVSVGDLLRRAATVGTQEARHISAVMARGAIVPSVLSTTILLRFLDENAHHMLWLVDGYPRTFANAVMFDSLHLKPAAVIALDVHEAVLKERLMQRGRRDDLPHVVDHRIVHFKTEYESIKEFYRRRNLLTELDASGSPEDVYHRYRQLRA